MTHNHNIFIFQIPLLCTEEGADPIIECRLLLHLFPGDIGFTESVPALCEGLMGKLCSIATTMRKRGFAADLDPLVASLLQGCPRKDSWYLDPVTFSMVQNTAGGIQERRRAVREARKTDFGYMDDDQ